MDFHRTCNQFSWARVSYCIRDFNSSCQYTGLFHNTYLSSRPPKPPPPEKPVTKSDPSPLFGIFLHLHSASVALSPMFLQREQILEPPATPLTGPGQLIRVLTNMRLQMRLGHKTT